MRKNLLIFAGLLVLFALAHLYLPFEFMSAQAVFVGTAAGVIMDPPLVIGGLIIAIVAASSSRELLGIVAGAILAAGITLYVAQTYHKELGLNRDVMEYIPIVFIRTWDVALMTVLVGFIARALKKFSSKEAVQ